MNPSKKILLFALIPSILVFLSGVLAFEYAYWDFKHLVPWHGGGESFGVAEYNNFQYQIPWRATNYPLHLTMTTNDTVDIYVDGTYITSGSYYELTVEPETSVLILLKSSSPVSGHFTAHFEIPKERLEFERKFERIALGVVYLGFVATILSGALWGWSQR